MINKFIYLINNNNLIEIYNYENSKCITFKKWHRYIKFSIVTISFSKKINIYNFIRWIGLKNNWYNFYNNPVLIADNVCNLKEFQIKNKNPNIFILKREIVYIIL